MEYATFQTILNESRSRNHPSEWHGVLCGLLCAGYPTSWQHWCQVLNDIEDKADVVSPGPSLSSALEEVCQETRFALNDSDLGFNLMLPSDDMPLEERVSALSRWCESFLYGLSVGGISQGAELPGDVRETLIDLAEISRADVELEITDSESEQHYIELVEYIRVAIMLLNDHLNPIRSIDSNLH